MIANLFPSASEMELDYWTASEDVLLQIKATHCRLIRSKAGAVIAIIPALAGEPNGRDVRARRVEMVGEIYEELRQLADRAQAAGLDVTYVRNVLSNFVVPKPLPRAKGGK